MSIGRGPGSTSEFIPTGDTSRTRVSVEDLNDEAATVWIALYEPIQ